MGKRDAGKDGHRETLIGAGTVLDGTFDIEYDVRVDGTLRGERLATRPILAVVGPNADFAEGSLEEALAVTPVYAYLAGSQRRMELDTWMVGRGLSPRVYAETNDLPLMIEATSRGNCLAFLPEPSVEGPLERGEVRRLAEVGISAEAYVLYHSQETPARVSGAVRRLRS